MNERDETHLLNMKDSLEVLIGLVDGYDFHQFLSDERTKLAVSMSLIKIGESVKSISQDLKQTYPDVQWISISNLRNIAAHNYEGLRMERVWEITTEDAPQLLQQIKRILHAEETEVEK